MSGSTVTRRALRASIVALCAALALAVVGCDTPAATQRPSPSLVVLDFTPLPSAPPEPGAPSAAPTLVSWPVGWDVAFCEMFSEAVVAQEVIVDVERAMDEGATADALGLARELGITATIATLLLDDLPAWDIGAQPMAELRSLLDLDIQASAEYETHLDNGGRAALRRARALRRAVEAAVPVVNEELALLAQAGLACPGQPLQLESP